MPEETTPEKVKVMERVPRKYRPMLKTFIYMLAVYGLILFMKKVFFKV